MPGVKEYRSLTVLLDLDTIEGLRCIAARRGLIAKRGPSAGKQQGSITQLLQQLVKEWRSDNQE